MQTERHLAASYREGSSRKDSGFSPNVEVSLCSGFKISERALLFVRLPGFARLPCESSAKVKMSVEQRWNGTDRGEQNYWEKTLSSATLSTTYLTWTDLESNSSVPGEGPQTNRLSHGTAQFKAAFNLKKAPIFSRYLAGSCCIWPITMSAANWLAAFPHRLLPPSSGCATPYTSLVLHRP